MQGDVHNRRHAIHIGLRQFPRLRIGKVFVSDAGEVHRFFLGIAEVEGIQQTLYVALYQLELFYRFAVVVRQFVGGRNFPVEIFLGQDQSAIDEVSEDSHQLVIVASLKVFPREIVVFRLWRVGGQDVTQDILLARHIDQIFVQPNGPVARG